MTNPERITPVDLKVHRKAAGMKQADLAARLHITRVHATRVETGAQSMSFPLALECARMFGSLTVSWKGRRYIIAPEGNGPTNPPDRPRSSRYTSLSQTEKIVVLGKELREAEAEVESLPKCLMDPEARRNHLKRLLRESIDVDQVIDALIESAPEELVREVVGVSA